jgi:hypothetical protein
MVIAWAHSSSQSGLGYVCAHLLLTLQGIIEPICQNGTSPDISRRTAEKGLEHWTCGTVRGLGPIQPYNPLAVLMDVPGARLLRLICLPPLFAAVVGWCHIKAVYSC